MQECLAALMQSVQGNAANAGRSSSEVVQQTQNSASHHSWRNIHPGLPAQECLAALTQSVQGNAGNAGRSSSEVVQQTQNSASHPSWRNIHPGVSTHECPGALMQSVQENAGRKILLGSCATDPEQCLPPQLEKHPPRSVHSGVSWCTDAVSTGKCREHRKILLGSCATDPEQCLPSQLTKNRSSQSFYLE